ncbi:MAG: N-acetylneuraminate synthase family protein [Pyrinomonadaceae bacterium]
MSKTEIIAEVGSVHDGSFGNALKLIDVAAQQGADVVKFQTHIASAETLRNAPMPPYFNGEPRYEYFERTAFSREQWRALKSHCEARGIEFLSSPFSIEAVELLESLEVARFKVPSGEVTNLPLLEAIASTSKPVLLSSGMSLWKELDEAVNTILRSNNRLTLMQCTSEYPCRYEHVGLNVMLEMRERYRLPVGLSDHTLTPYASIAAVVLGAAVIEKHLTFSREMYGSDAKHSMLPAEFGDLVGGIRAVETMLSTRLDKDAATIRLQHMKGIFEKSVVSLVDIEDRSLITPEMVGTKKPGTGIPAARLKEVIGKRAAHAIAKDSLILEEDLVS